MGKAHPSLACLCCASLAALLEMETQVGHGPAAHIFSDAIKHCLCWL